MQVLSQSMVLNYLPLYVIFFHGFLQVDVKTFHMQVDIDKFEEKLRDAEAKLGIKAGHGIPVVYERGEDAIGKFLASLILGGILLSLFVKGKGLKAPGIGDMFVRTGPNIFRFHAQSRNIE